MPELLVCRRHGGGTLNAQVTSLVRQAQMKHWAAERAWLEARGTKDEDTMLARYGDAQVQLRRLQERVAYLRLLQRAVYLRELEARVAAQREARGTDG